MEGSDDIICPRFSISMGGKALFTDARLALIHGHRYGLIGPNGCGKSTLMHAIGYGTCEEIKKAIPPNTDILLVEQEVAASDEITALQMVVAADTRRTALLAEARTLERLTDAYNLSLDESNGITPDELEAGGVRYIKEAKLQGDSFAVGAKLTFEGREVTVLEEKDKDGDITIQDVVRYDEERLNEVYDELQDIGADSAEQRASAILSGLQFLEEQKAWPTASFSGGWRMRISLARALFRKPRLLLLDEPTNHLDLHAVLWLEGYLQKWKHTLVVVSHDRDFLGTVCTDTLHCWQSKLQDYKGGYETFAKVFSTRLEEYQAEYTRQQKKLKDLRRQGKVSKELGKKDGGADTTAYKKQMQLVLGKASQKQRELAGFGGAGGGDGSDDEQGMLDEIKGLNMHITFPVAGEIPMPILAVDEVDFRYSIESEDPANPDGPPLVKPGPLLFTGVDFGLNMDSRIALVGANGTGKSTLLKLMLGELEPTQGEVRQSRMCKIGFYNQHSTDQLAKGVRLAAGEALTPVSYLRHTFPELNVQMIRNALGKFGLEGHHHLQEIATLSGGQKSRVVFVEMGLRKTHLLLLDEPTNHLDLETVDCLVEGLKHFKGGVLVITHNVELINKVCKEIWVIEDQKVGRFRGEFEEYRQMLEEQLHAIADEDPEEKRREKERLERVAAKKAQEAAAAGGGGAKGPKSKAERDRERKEAREAKAAKDAAEAAEKERLATEQREAAAAELAAAAASAKAAADARLKRESELASAVLSARGRPLVEVVAQLAEHAAGPLAVCGGLLVLCEEHAPQRLLAPLLSVVVARLAAAGVDLAADPSGAASTAAAAEVVGAWQQPVGWLVCRCADRREAQLELLRATCDSLGEAALLAQAAPLLKALWEADLIEEELLLGWAETLRPSLRRCVEPFVTWLRTAAVDAEN